MGKKIVFIWDNFGPIHADRADAVGKYFKNQRAVIGIELNARSDTYEWDAESGSFFSKITLRKNFKFICLVLELLKLLGSDYFFCHYERPKIFACACFLRMLGQRVYVMNDSKFDDYPRSLFREVVKYIFYMPYMGGLASGTRSRDYLRFLGVDTAKTQVNYNSMSVERIRSYNFSLDKDFSSRYFLVIARFVEKKNLFHTLNAYKHYVDRSENPRLLYLVGSGPLESDLIAAVKRMELESFVVFTGFLQTRQTMQILSGALALLLLSTEEQFGNVVIEATALGIPCIVSSACGARDLLIRTGDNGFVVEPDNVVGTSFYMDLLSKDENVWRSMSAATTSRVKYCDVKQFVLAVNSILN